VSGANFTAAGAIFWGVILLAAILAMGVVLWLVRRWLFSAPAQSGDTWLSLQHLREMKAQGRITEQEFEALKSRALAESRGSAAEKDRGASAGSR